MLYKLDSLNNFTKFIYNLAKKNNVINLNNYMSITEK